MAYVITPDVQFWDIAMIVDSVVIHISSVAMNEINGLSIKF